MRGLLSLAKVFSVLLLVACGGNPDEEVVLSPAIPVVGIATETMAIEATAEVATATSTLLPSGEGEFEGMIPTIPPPLEGVDFPDESIQYPSEWPVELHYSSEFLPLEAEQGMLPDKTSTAWIAKHRFLGSPDDAALLLIDHYSSDGWEVVSYPLDSGGALVTLTRNNGTSTGTLLIDSDSQDIAATVVLTTVRL